YPSMVASLHRRLTRVSVVFAALAGAIALYAACGLTVLPGGAVDEGEAGAPKSDGGLPLADGSPPPPDDPHAQSQASCDSPRSKCETGCTDTATDPANCGACGTKCGTGEACTARQCGVLCL